MGAWLSRIRSTGLLGISLWILGLPAALAVLVMFLRTDHTVPDTHFRIDTLEHWTEPLPPGSTYDLPGFKVLMNRKPNFSSATWTTISMPSVIELSPQFSARPDEPMARAWFRFKVRVPPDHTPGEPLALYATRIMGGAHSLWVDGSLTVAHLDDWRMQWSYPVLMELPLRAVRPGQDLELALAVPYRLSQGYAVGSLYFGNAHDLRAPRDIRLLLQRTLPIMGIVLVGLMGLLSLAMWTRRKAETEHLWLALLSVAVVICNLQYTHEFSANETMSAWFGFIVDSAVSWLFLLFVVFCLRFNKLRYPRTEFVLTAFTVANTILTMPFWNWQVNGMVLQHYLTAALYVYVLALFTWLAVRHRTFEHILFGLALWALLASGIHDVSMMATHLAPDQIWIFPYGAFLVFIIAEVLLQRRYVKALAVIERNNQGLAQKLLDRETELLARQEELLITQRNHASLAERGRLVREIHDSIGATLADTLGRLRGGAWGTGEAAESVRACLDDLKIMIESLDPSARDLPVLLGGLRYRFADRLKAAGVKLEWHMEELPELPWLDAPQALDILRAVHAIVTRAVVHAGARKIVLCAQACKAEGSGLHIVRISLEDDGPIGMDHPTTLAQDIMPLHSRLADLGAVVRVAPLPGPGRTGTRYEMDLPT